MSEMQTLMKKMADSFEAANIADIIENTNDRFNQDPSLVLLNGFLLTIAGKETPIARVVFVGSNLKKFEEISKNSFEKIFEFYTREFFYLNSSSFGGNGARTEVLIDKAYLQGLIPLNEFVERDNPFSVESGGFYTGSYQMFMTALTMKLMFINDYMTFKNGSF